MADTAAGMADTAAPTTMSQAERQTRALQIVKANCGWSTAAGIIPVPLLDLAAIGTVQYRMVRQLTDLYGVPYNARAVDSIVGALVGSGGVLVASPVAGSVLKMVPVAGTFLSTFVVPATAAASTYALGKVFIQHFESGGTLLSLDPEAHRNYYYNEFRNAEAGSKV
jgi:uncharacterized protein (DUF697 family)